MHTIHRIRLHTKLWPQITDRQVPSYTRPDATSPQASYSLWMNADDAAGAASDRWGNDCRRGDEQSRGSRRARRRRAPGVFLSARFVGSTGPFY